MDIDKYMQSMSQHEALQKQLETLIQNDKATDSVLRNSLINKRDSLQQRISELESQYREQSLLEKQLFEKERIRDLHNLQQIDKRSSYTKFK